MLQQDVATSALSNAPKFQAPRDRIHCRGSGSGGCDVTQVKVAFSWRSLFLVGRLLYNLPGFMEYLGLGSSYDTTEPSSLHQVSLLSGLLQIVLGPAFPHALARTRKNQQAGWVHSKLLLGSGGFCFRQFSVALRASLWTPAV